MKEGADVRINCNVFGNPTPRISWKRYEATQEVALPGTVVYENQTTTMVIRMASPEYSGTYKCKAESKTGRSEAATFLWIGKLCVKCRYLVLTYNAFEK